MDASVIALFVTVCTILSGAIIWNIRQEGRINSLHVMFTERERYDSLRERTESGRYADMKEQYSDMKDHLIRIETKLDDQRRDNNNNHDSRRT